jgi:ribosomal-protein-serine acetyltransferase
MPSRFRPTGRIRVHPSCGRAPFSRVPRAKSRWFLLLGWRGALGLRLGPRSSSEYVLGWRIAETSPEAVRLELRSAIMTAHLLLRVASSTAVLTTNVYYTRPLAHPLWAGVSLIHRQLIPYLLGRAASFPRPATGYEEIQLRLLEERHVEHYFALIEHNKAYLQEWIAVEAYEGPVETLRAYMKQRLLHFVEGSGYHLGIWYQDALVGLLDYRLNGRTRSVELGYWLDAAMQGKSIVTQACRTMLRLAFEEHQVHKVVISCTTDNRRSRAVAERLGFVQEGILRQADRLHDRYVDMVFYGLLKVEWNAETERAKADITRKPSDGA